jgi:outer membrane cobalamin receptor
MNRTAGGITVRQDAGRLSWSADLDVDHEHETDRDSLPTFGGPPYNDRVSATNVDGRAAATWGWHGVALTVGGEARTLDVTASALSDSAPGHEYEDGVWSALRVGHRFGPVLATLDAAVRADWASLVRGATLSPHGGVSLADGPVTVSVDGGQSFSPPTLADEFFHEGVLVKPNPDLQPERVRGEVEGRIAVRDVGWDALRVSAQAAAYRADVSGMILWFPNFQFVWSPQNSDVHRSGWDAGGEITLPHVGVAVRGSVSDVAVEYAGPVLGGQVAYRPRVTADLGARATHGRFTLDWTSRYIGDRRTVQGSGLNALAAYWVSDAHLTVRVVNGGWPVDVFGGVDDLFDRRADLLVDYPYAGRTWVVGLRVRSPSFHQ